MSLLRRGAVGLALTTALVAGSVPASNADNLGLSDGVTSITSVSLGSLCRGATASKTVPFALQRRGAVNNNVWASSAEVSITGATAADGFTLGSLTATTPSNWTASDNYDLPVGSAGVALTVPATATLGTASAKVTWTATGRGAQVASLSKSVDLNVTWTVTSCAPADTTPPQVSYVLDPATPSGTNGWYREPVTVDWTVSDAQSTAVPAGCDDVTFSSDGTHTSTCSATSAGGASGPVSATVKVDRTAPTVVPTVLGDLGDDGWYTDDVEVTWSVSDAAGGSGIATTSPDCAGTTLSTDTVSATYTCTVTDKAGNHTSVVREVKRDATVPTIARSVSGTLGENGWYVGDVTVDWTVSDDTSKLASTSGCEDVVLTTDTAGTTYSCTATDNAGNTATSDSIHVKRDATAPTVTYSLSGTEGANNWFRGPVTVTWTATDGGSGLTQGCAAETISADGVHTPACTAYDKAGNASDTSEALVQIDATEPVITPTVVGTKTLPGSDWYTSDVSVTWEVTDATSNVATKTGCDKVDVVDDTEGTTYTCAATDVAGNDASRSVTVKRDATAPTVTYSLSGTEGADNWFRGPVTVTWTATDGGSGLAQGCAAETISADGVHTPACTAYDTAGNASDTSEALVKIDATKPVITPTVVGTKTLPGSDWYTSDVSITWEVTDATSNVATKTGCDKVSVVDDTEGTTYTCAATDVAGNDASRSVTVKRDATAPELTLVGGPADGATYHFGDVPAASTCIASDTTSGLAAPCSVSAGGTAVGGATQSVTVTDRAGNVATDTRRYTVAAWRLDGFYKPVNMGSTVVNTVKAGSTVPLKFNVYKGTAPMTANTGAMFTTRKISCTTGDVQDPFEEFLTSGATSLRYDATGGQWIQNWATPGSGKGSCYRVTMTTADGSSIAADFLLK